MATRIGEIRVNAIKQELKDSNIIKELQDVNGAQANYIGELEKIVKDLTSRFIKGGLSYIEHNGYVVGVTQIFSDSEYTHDQPIPKEIGTVKYNACPFHIMNNRQLEIDKTKKARYDSI